MASLATLLNFADVAPESDRTKTLLHGFELAARLGGISNDLKDWDAMKQIDHIMDDIVVALAAIGPGCTLLVPLLEHDNARIRVLAGRYLIDLMPDRVVPILEKATFWCSRLGKLSVEDDSTRSRVEWRAGDPSQHRFWQQLS